MWNFESQKQKGRPLSKHRYWQGSGSFTFDGLVPLFPLAFLEGKLWFSTFVWNMVSYCFSTFKKLSLFGFLSILEGKYPCVRLCCRRVVYWFSVTIFLPENFPGTTGHGQFWGNQFSGPQLLYGHSPETDVSETVSGWPLLPYYLLEHNQPSPTSQKLLYCDLLSQGNL